MAAEVPAFDEENCAVEHEGPSRFVATFPKADPDPDPTAEKVRIEALDGEPHADAFPGRTPKTLRLSLEAGERVPEHEHPDRTVLFHVLTGTIDVRLDDEPRRVESGEILRFDGSSRVEPTAREDSTALVVLAPRSAE